MQRAKEASPNGHAHLEHSASSIEDQSHNPVKSKLMVSSLYSGLDGPVSIGLEESALTEELAELPVREQELICPSCSTQIAFFALSCPNCNSTEIMGGNVLEHLKCSNYDSEENFKTPDGKFSCQKCGDSSLDPSIDYVSRGVHYKCFSCSSFIDEPQALITCMSCGYSSAKEQKLSFNSKSRPSFRFPIQKASSSNIEPIVRKVRARGWFALPLKSLMGKSGVEHEFSLVVSRSPLLKLTQGKHLLVAEVISSASQVSEIQLLAFFAKALDVGVKNRILVAIPTLGKDARKFADSYGITSLEASSHDAAFELLVTKIGEMMEKSQSSHETPKSRPAKSVKRTSFGIIADILTIAEKPVSKTEILYRANLSFKQAEKYLSMLEKMGLLKKYFEDGVNRRFLTTQRGSEYLLNSFKQFGRISETSSSVWGSKKDIQLL